MGQPFLQQASVQDVYDFLLQHNNKLFSFVSELVDIMLTGEDQSQADQPNSLAEGPPEHEIKHACSETEASCSGPYRMAKQYDGFPKKNYPTRTTVQGDMRLTPSVSPYLICHAGMPPLPGLRFRAEMACREASGTSRYVNNNPAHGMPQVACPHVKGSSMPGRHCQLALAGLDTPLSPALHPSTKNAVYMFGLFPRQPSLKTA
eukprot:1153644-Pelagomonas_calceolata.AAC.8